MDRRRFKPEFPKPFDFVPFVEKPDKQIRPGHESFHLKNHLSGKLVYQIKVQTPLHISSGSYALTDEDLGMEAKQVVRDLYKVTVDGVKLPAIPGSSLKGASRAVVEAVTASCIGVTRVKRQDLPRENNYTCRPPKLCPACGLFGAMNRQSRLIFGDAVFVNGDAVIALLPALYRPRPRYGNAYRTPSRQYKGRKFYFLGIPQTHRKGTYVEVLKPGTVLQGTIAFTGLLPAELGLLLFSLGLDSSFQLAVGGGKPVAFGRIAVEPQALHLRQADAFTTYDGGDEILADEALVNRITAVIDAANALILPDQRKKLQEILDPASKRKAPTGIY